MNKAIQIDLEQCSIRLARPEDKTDLLRVAKGIWGGTDYLPKVLDRWISEPWFLACEYRGKVIACLKMTLFPDNVLWFEGLRVQARYQNQGIAKLLNRHAFGIANALRQENAALAYEFATYYLNVESLHLTQKLGFKMVDKFYDLRKRGVKTTRKPIILHDFELKYFHHYPIYIPCAWQTVHNHPDSLTFLKEHGCLFQTPQAVYYLGGLHEPSITLLEPPAPRFREDLPYLQHFFGSGKSYGMIMASAFRPALPFLKKHGFHFWEKEQEVENMLVFRM